MPANPTTLAQFVVLVRLRQRVAGLLAAGRAAGNPAASGPGPAAGDPLGVLADVLSRADQRAGALAGYADAARFAGQACERGYDALNGSPQGPVASGSSRGL
ncbi:MULTISPECIES: DUF2514 family protein [unclassified Cupriavidus]|uniref:DUF2514 family protein n=1 Tax=unclassified Cupriavidus TaxID=2640874 RepID=UPI003F93D060